MPLNVPLLPQADYTPTEQATAHPLSDNGLGAIAQGTLQAGQQLEQQRVEEQKKRNATRVMDAVAHDLGDAERGMRESMRTRKGANAYGVTGDVTSWWDSEPSKIEGKLDNETQKLLFREEVARRREVSLNSFRTYEDSENDRAVNDSTVARINNSVDYGASNAGDNAAMSKAREDIINAVSVQARFNGMSPDEHTRALLDATTKLHTNIIENIAQADPEAAMTYYKDHKDEIAGSVRDGILSKITGSKDVVAAQRLSDNVWNRGFDEPKALDAIRNESEGAQREHALALTRQRFAEQRANVELVDKRELESARTAFSNGGITALTPAMVNTMQRVSPSELRFMRSQTPQDQVQSNWDVYQGLIDLARKEPANFRDNTDLAMFRGDLNSAELATLGKVQDDLKKGIPSSVLTLNEIVSNSVPGGTDQQQQKQLFERSVLTSVEDEQKRLNRKLTGDEMQKIVDTKLINITVSNPWYWFARSKPAFAMTPSDYSRAFESVPTDARSEIDKELATRPQFAKDTPEQRHARIVDVYNAFLHSQQK